MAFFRDDWLRAVSTVVDLDDVRWIVLSHDASCFMDYFGDAYEQTIAAAAPNWHFGHISDDVLPALRARGVTDAQLEQMLVTTPRAASSFRI